MKISKISIDNKTYQLPCPIYISQEEIDNYDYQSIINKLDKYWFNGLDDLILEIKKWGTQNVTGRQILY